MLTRAWIVEQFQNFLNYLLTIFIPRYNIMPDEATLLAMPITNNDSRPFYVKGFYTPVDGNGGMYYITSSWTKGGRKITNGTTTRFLVALNQYGSVSNVIDLARYGIRAVNSVDYDTINPTDSYATENSRIFKSIYLPNKHGTFKLPRGRFVFAETLDLYQSGRYYSLVGESGVSFDIRNSELYTSSEATTGTMLYFPWLLDEQYAINGRFCSIENIIVIGNPKTYNISFDRTKFATEPSSVVTETIDNDTKCVGIYSSQCKLINVGVMNFYTGVKIITSNCYINTVFAAFCHLGFEINNDIKVLGMYGGNVHTLASFFGAISSVTQARVDSCVNMFNVKHGNGFTFVDIDGDWCADSLFLIGESGKASTIRESTFIGVHGRCNTLKSRLSSESVTDVRMINDTTGYGIFRVVGNCTFKDNTIILGTWANHSPGDGNHDYLLPEVILTFDSSNNVITDNIFIINGSLTEEQVKKMFQLKAGITSKVSCGNNTYLINGTDVGSNVTMAEVQAYVEELLNRNNGDDAV